MFKYDCETQFYIKYEKLHYIAKRDVECNFYLFRSYLLMKKRFLFENVKLKVIKIFDAIFK